MDADVVRLYLRRAGLSDAETARLLAIGYLDAPASARRHLAVPGGLARHSCNVAARLHAFGQAVGVPWSRPESPWRVAMLHDLVKCRCYRLNSVTGRFDYVSPGYPGHGEASARIAEELGIALAHDERAAIAYHMGAFGIGAEYIREWFDDALARFPAQLIATHAADWAASAIDEKGGAE